MEKIGVFLEKKSVEFGYRYMMTIDEINKKIDNFEEILVSDVRNILCANYPQSFSFYIAYGNIHDDIYININDEVVSSEKIYTYLKITNTQMFDNVSVFVQLKNLINKNVNFKEVLPFIERLKNIYKDNLDYSKIKLYFNIKGSIHSGKFTYKKYGTEFYATKSQILNGKYRESYSNGIIKVKPIEDVYCDIITGLNQDSKIPVHVTYGGCIFEISTYQDTFQYNSHLRPWMGKHIVDESVPYYNGILNPVKNGYTIRLYTRLECTIYFENGCDIKSIHDISYFLFYKCQIQGLDCFIKKDGTVDLIDNHKTIYPKIVLNHKVTKCPIPSYVKFGICEGHFDYSNMGTDNLIGCPDIVYGDFDCSKNNLKDLTGIPSEIYGKLNISYNPLTNSSVDNVEVDVHSGKINYRGTCIESNYIK